MSVTKVNKKGPFLLFLAAAIWGVAFVAQSAGMEYIGPFTFNGIRCLLGGAVLLPLIPFLNPKREAGLPCEDKKTLAAGGILCGLCLCAASTLQQIGLQYTTAGKAGFLTAMYIVLVPVLGLFAGKKCSPFVGISILLAIVGLYLLSIQDGFTIGTGDICVIICALVFSLHILTIDYFSPKVSGVKLSCIQFFVCGIICTPIGFILEKPELGQIMAAWLPIAYAGIMSCGVAYTLQIIGQKNMNPTVASLVMSLEAVVSALAGWLILKETLSLREITGCVIMFAAIIMAQLPGKEKS